MYLPIYREPLSASAHAPGMSDIYLYGLGQTIGRKTDPQTPRTKLGLCVSVCAWEWARSGQTRGGGGLCSEMPRSGYEMPSVSCVGCQSGPSSRVCILKEHDWTCDAACANSKNDPPTRDVLSTARGVQRCDRLARARCGSINGRIKCTLQGNMGTDIRGTGPGERGQLNT